MTENHPKRRKDKYNPYNICQTDGKYYISFRGGQGVLQELEISRKLYDTFNDFELADLSHLNIVDRHLEQSEVWENTLSVRAFYQPETVEDIVFHNIQVEHLHKAIQCLPKIQRHRLLLYYFEGMDVIECFEDANRSLRIGEVLNKQIQIYETFGVDVTTSS